MASNDHTVYLRQGSVTSPAQPNTNPSVAQNPNASQGTSPVGTAIKATVFIQAGKQIMNEVIGSIGEITGDYELQETAETIVSVAGAGIGLVVAPAVAVPALIIKTGFDIYAINIKQNRSQFKAQQAQVLTGKISVNGGRWS